MPIRLSPAMRPDATGTTSRCKGRRRHEHTPTLAALATSAGALSYDRGAP
jgi:hypothetical protein